jgi:hypothetical protein
MLDLEARELLHGKLIGDRCSARPEGEFSRSPTPIGPAAVEEGCPPQVSHEEGDAATGHLGRHVYVEAHLDHRPSSPMPPSAGLDAGPSDALSPEKNETIPLDMPPFCSSPLVDASSFAALECQKIQASSQVPERLQAPAQGAMGKPGDPQVSAAPPPRPSSSSSTVSRAAPDGPASSSLLVPGRDGGNEVNNGSLQVSCRELLVYSQRRDRQRIDPPATHADEAANPVTPQGPSFISRMSKTIRGAVSQPPLMPKRRVKTLPSGATPS